MLPQGRSAWITDQANRGTTSLTAPHGGATLTAAVTGLPRSVLLTPTRRVRCVCRKRSSESSPVMAGSMLVPPVYALRGGIRSHPPGSALAASLSSSLAAPSPSNRTAP